MGDSGIWKKNPKTGQKIQVMEKHACTATIIWIDPERFVKLASGLMS
jgi:hypothetical protein